MTRALDRVLRWGDVAEPIIDRHALKTPVWVVLAIIHVESSGWVRPERHVQGPDYAAEGLLQITPIAAEDAGVGVEEVDGRGGWSDGVRSLEVWGELTDRYVGAAAPVYDYPLFWLSGSGTLKTAQSERSRLGYWPAWWQAAEEAPGAVTVHYVLEYAQRWQAAAVAYWRATKAAA